MSLVSLVLGEAPNMMVKTCLEVWTAFRTIDIRMAVSAVHTNRRTDKLVDLVLPDALY
jgi:hypothetical protein